MRLFLGILIISLLFLVGCTINIEPDYDTNNYEKEIELYVSPIEDSNIEFREKGVEIIQDCPTNDKACQVSAIYQYVLDNYQYYSDPRRDEFVQDPYQTVFVGGGDCEDLTILLNSYLENVGIETYIVLTDNHAYSLACGVDAEELGMYNEKIRNEQINNYLLENPQFIEEDGAIYLFTTEEETISLDPGFIKYIGHDGEELVDPYPLLTIKYQISSDLPLNVYIVPSYEDFSSFSESSSFSSYETCNSYSLFKKSDECGPLDKNGGLIIENTDLENDATIDYKIDFYYSVFYSKFTYSSNLTITSYILNGENCVVLDPTVENGYAGYDGNLEGEKTAINSITHEYFLLE